MEREVYCEMRLIEMVRKDVAQTLWGETLTGCDLIEHWRQ